MCDIKWKYLSSRYHIEKLINILKLMTGIHWIKVHVLLQADGEMVDSNLLLYFIYCTSRIPNNNMKMKIPYLIVKRTLVYYYYF